MLYHSTSTSPFAFEHHDPVLDQCPTCPARSFASAPRSHLHDEGDCLAGAYPLTLLSPARLPRTRPTCCSYKVSTASLVSWSKTISLALLVALSASPRALTCQLATSVASSSSPKVPPDKYVHMDQGGGCTATQGRALFRVRLRRLSPTGADSSGNGPVEQAHQTSGDALRASYGAQLDPPVSGHAYYFLPDQKNALPSRR
jgi:hypothetical protein